VLCPNFVRTRIFESERNMPRNSRATPRTRGAEIKKVAAALVNAGIDAADVAKAVEEAVVNEKFWILTHEHSAFASPSCVSSGCAAVHRRWRTRQRQRLAIDAARQLVDRPVEQRDRAVAGEAVGHTRDVGDAEFQRLRGAVESLVIVGDVGNQ